MGYILMIVINFKQSIMGIDQMNPNKLADAYKATRLKRELKELQKGWA